MTREQLREVGLTDEQVNSVMVEHAKDLQAEKSKSETYKTDALKTQELLKQIDALQKDKTDADKTLENKDNEIAEVRKQIESLQKEIKNKELKANLAEKGITGENADKLISGLSEGNLDVETLGIILATTSQSAVDAKIKELEGKAINPNGGKADPAPAKSEVEVMAENIGKSFAESNKASADVLAQYIK